MLRYIPWYRLSVIHALFLLSGVLAAQFLPGRNEVEDITAACYWTIEILPYVECGHHSAFPILAEIFYNAWLLPLYGVAFAASILGALFSGGWSEAIRQVPGLALISLQMALIVVSISGSFKRLIRSVAHNPTT